MSMPIEKIDIYKYSISDITLTSPAWTKPRTISSTMISSIAIANNYDNAIVPQLSIDCNVDHDTYYEILAKSESLYASFTISMGNLGTANNLNDSATDGDINTGENAVYNEEYCKCDMKAVDKGYLYSRDVVDNQLDSSQTDKNSDGENFQIKLFLLDHKKLIQYRKHKSFIINGNLNDTLYEVIVGRGFNNIIMEGTDAVERSDYFAPYGDLGKNLSDLNDYYGLYDYNYLFYMGLDRTYMISKGNLGKTVEYGELGTVNIYIEPYDATKSGINKGCYKDEINKVYVLGTTDATIDNVDSLVDFATGGKVTSVIYGTETHITEKIGTEDIEAANVVNNRKMHSQVAHALQESKRFLTVAFANVDLNIITPNKKYVVIANQKYYDIDYDISGDYRLSSDAIILSNDGNGSFVASISLSLLKIN